MSTGIPYLDAVWSPTIGCAGKDDSGMTLPCRERCWAAGMAHRFHRDFTPRFQPEHLTDPLRMRKPKVIGVCFGGDLFDPAITDEQIAAVFGVMGACPQHTFVLITKQAARMERFFAWLCVGNGDSADWSKINADVCAHRAMELADVGGNDPRLLPFHPGTPWPLPHVWLGVSVSTQEDAAERIPHLLRCPAAVHWVSAEPLLEELDIRVYLDGHGSECSRTYCKHAFVDWVVTAAESGPQARPCNLNRVRSLRDQASAAGIPFVFKDQRGYPLLDGAVHNAMPVSMSTPSSAGVKRYSTGDA